MEKGLLALFLFCLACPAKADLCQFLIHFASQPALVLQAEKISGAVVTPLSDLRPDRAHALIVGALPGPHGGRLRLALISRRVDVDLNDDECGFRGSPLWVMRALGPEAARFLGFRIVEDPELQYPDHQLILLPDAHELNAAIVEYNRLFPNDRLVHRFYEPPLDQRVDSFDYVEKLTEFQHPMGFHGREALHDTDYHLFVMFQSARAERAINATLRARILWYRYLSEVEPLIGDIRTASYGKYREAVVRPSIRQSSRSFDHFTAVILAIPEAEVPRTAYYRGDDAERQNETGFDFLFREAITQSLWTGATPLDFVRRDSDFGSAAEWFQKESAQIKAAFARFAVWYEHHYPDDKKVDLRHLTSPEVRELIHQEQMDNFRRFKKNVSGLLTR